MFCSLPVTGQGELIFVDWWAFNLHFKNFERCSRSTLSYSKLPVILVYFQPMLTELSILFYLWLPSGHSQQKFEEKTKNMWYKERENMQPVPNAGNMQLVPRAGKHATNPCQARENMQPTRAKRGKTCKQHVPSAGKHATNACQAWENARKPYHD